MHTLSPASTLRPLPPGGVRTPHSHLSAQVQSTLARFKLCVERESKRLAKTRRQDKEKLAQYPKFMQAALGDPPLPKDLETAAKLKPYISRVAAKALGVLQSLSEGDFTPLESAARVSNLGLRPLCGGC